MSDDVVKYLQSQLERAIEERDRSRVALMKIRIHVCCQNCYHIQLKGRSATGGKCAVGHDPLPGPWCEDWRPLDGWGRR